MILLLHNNNEQIREYAQYLRNENIDHYEITAKDLIDNGYVNDSFDRNKTFDTLWKFPDLTIDFSKLTGIYHDIYYLDDSLFNDFIEEDKIYAKTEWHAYLLYRLNATKNIINPVNHLQVSSKFQQFQAIIEIGKQMGFTTPKYYYSTEVQDYKDYIAQTDYPIIIKNGFYDNYQQSSTKEISEAILSTLPLIVEYQRGAPLWIYVVDNKVMSTIMYAEGREDFLLPQQLESKCITLVKNLGLIFAEIFMKRTVDNQYFLYYVSRQPNLEFSTRKIEIWEKLTNLLGSHLS